MALLATNGIPPPHFPGSFSPNNRIYFGRNDKDDLSEYYHHVAAFGGQKHPIQDKFNYVKNLINEKIHKKLHRGGGGGYYEHSGHESKDQSAAVSALTLLAFLFFLYILQSCIREHVNQIMAATETTTVAPTAAFREMRQQKNKKGEIEDEYFYSDEESEEISVKPPVKIQPRTTPTTSLQVYESNTNFNKYFHERNLEPVRLITKS